MMHGFRKDYVNLNYNNTNKQQKGNQYLINNYSLD